MWTKRIARRIARTRNPLRRTSDRIEAWMTFVVVMTILVTAPCAGWWAARETYRDDLRTNAWELQHTVQVAAVLLKDPTSTRGELSEGVPPPSTVLTPARWTGPDGVIRIGMVLVDVGKRGGSTVLVWVNDQGVVTGPPAYRSPATDAVMVAILVMSGIAAALAGIRRIVIWRLNRRRLRSWQAEWLVVGPGWSHR
jgi:hypothetical protein